MVCHRIPVHQEKDFGVCLKPPGEQLIWHLPVVQILRDAPKQRASANVETQLHFTNIRALDSPAQFFGAALGIGRIEENDSVLPFGVDFVR